ncbi:MAG: hypothetical protein KH152_08185 [Finegoldia magna]|nr:hypothetical protein [Finegoldia magna]
MNKYDKVIGKQFGIIQGEKYLVFIKTGRGGSIEGFENKYLSICSFLFEKYGYTFVVCANPKDSVCDLEEEIKCIDTYIGDYKEIVFVGISNGAFIGAAQCRKIKKIKNAVLINAPLMINFHKIKEGAQKFRGDNMYFLYGEDDPSCRYIEILNVIKNTACKYKIIKGEGHDFSKESLISELNYFLTELLKRY